MIDRDGSALRPRVGKCVETGRRGILDKAYDHGLTFLDTSDAYPLGGGLETIGVTEEILGRWMKDKGNRGALQIATKCFVPTARLRGSRDRRQGPLCRLFELSGLAPR